MDTNTRPDAVAWIPLAEPAPGVTVRIRATDSHYDAEFAVAGDFVNSSVRTRFEWQDTETWRMILRAITRYEEDDDPQPEEAFTADWPDSPDPARLRFVIGEASRVEIHDGSDSDVFVSVPLLDGQAWITESMKRWDANRADFGFPEGGPKT
ncbi:DUF5959 family protein [Embleya sp. NPDC005971]|uniref:DUF5959 family protein n=1 Tax=Embleya sp. NPDC005971 TaxID=3156724 RepID=UPI00340C9D8D